MAPLKQTLLLHGPRPAPAPPPSDPSKFVQLVASDPSKFVQSVAGDWGDPLKQTQSERPPQSSKTPDFTALPLQVWIEVNHLLALLGTLDTPTLHHCIQALTTVLEQRAAQVSAVQLQETLAQKTVPELKALAQELGLSLRSRLKKADIIAAIVTAQTQPYAPPSLAPDCLPADLQADLPSQRDNRAAWEQFFAEVDALEYDPPDPAKNANDSFLEKFRRQGLNV